MGHSVTLGGDRLGSGKKQKVHLHGFERSTHDLSYIWRSTMSAGTLVPFMKNVALPGDTFDINLRAEVLTHPTVGPLFGSYKVQLDVFTAPIRLYQGKLHNNKMGIGLDMSQITLPNMTLGTRTYETIQTMAKGGDIDNVQISPSCILSYLGIRGIGVSNSSTIEREFNAVPLLAYWDIFKNYYANKQEENAYFIFHPNPDLMTDVTNLTVTGSYGGATSNITEYDPADPQTVQFTLVPGAKITLTNNNTKVVLEQLQLHIIDDASQPQPENLTLSNTSIFKVNSQTSAETEIEYIGQEYYKWVSGYIVLTAEQMAGEEPKLQWFRLSTLDAIREAILSEVNEYQVNLNSLNYDGIGGNPIYRTIDPLQGYMNRPSAYRFNQQGLAVKTYQSDLFNNWIDTEWIDGVNGINAITAIDTSGGEFTIDTLNLSKKVYDMLNRIAISGGTYYDWLDAVYDHNRIERTETPVYCGGLIRELSFQEVISQAATPEEPLGSLAGQGKLTSKNKGGHIRIKVDEPCYILGIVSLTPRIDYSQGNQWDVHLRTMDDFHKPSLDGIGFQELITEQMAWWDTTEISEEWVQHSAGKQPAWLNYMTDVNRTYGNFAIRDNEMFMTLNRRYEIDPSLYRIKDLTTYIDPAKFNYIFAETRRDAQNFWVQIGANITARRKMSARVMPNL